MQMIRQAAEAPYSFIYVDLSTKTPERMLWLHFERRLALRSIEEGDEKVVV